MREIKFRAWDKGLSKFHYPELWDRSMPSNWKEWYEITQFTGLHDKNGKEIYEGDIVVKDGYKWFDEGRPNYRGVVEWIYSQWQVVAYCINNEKRGISTGINEGLNDKGFEEGTLSEWEVIGNVHENPELLK